MKKKIRFGDVDNGQKFSYREHSNFLFVKEGVGIAYPEELDYDITVSSYLPPRWAYNYLEANDIVWVKVE